MVLKASKFWKPKHHIVQKTFQELVGRDIGGKCHRTNINPMRRILRLVHELQWVQIGVVHKICHPFRGAEGGNSKRWHEMTDGAGEVSQQMTDANDKKGVDTIYFDKTHSLILKPSLLYRIFESSDIFWNIWHLRRDNRS